MINEITDAMVMDMDDVADLGATINELFQKSSGADLRGIVGDLERRDPPRAWVPRDPEEDTCGW